MEFVCRVIYGVTNGEAREEAQGEAREEAREDVHRLAYRGGGRTNNGGLDEEGHHSLAGRLHSERGKWKEADHMFGMMMSLDPLYWFAHWPHHFAGYLRTTKGEWCL